MVLNAVSTYSSSYPKGNLGLLFCLVSIELCLCIPLLMHQFQTSVSFFLIIKAIEVNLREWEDEKRSLALETAQAHRAMSGQGKPADEENNFGEAERHSKLRER